MNINGQELTPVQELLLSLRRMGLNEISDDAYKIMEGLQSELAALREEVKQAEGRGAREMYSAIELSGLAPAMPTKELAMQLWRESRKGGGEDDRRDRIRHGSQGLP